MESFIREYAVRSILPHLHNSGGALQRYVRYAVEDAVASMPSSNSAGSSGSHNDSLLPGLTKDSGDSAESANDYYFITSASAQQLLNDSESVVAATTATSAELVARSPLTYNESSYAIADSASVQVLSTLTATMRTIGEFAANSATAAVTATTPAAGELNMTAEMCDDSAEDVSALSTAYFKTIVYLLYIPIFIFALLGNGTVCYIVQSTPRMRTVTNYFIANLAVGDILMSLFCVPFSFVSIFILKHWPFGTVLCNLVNYSQAVSVLVSAYTLVAISIDRYLAIMRPLRPRITKRLAKFIIAGVWTIALATALPILIVSKLSQPETWFIECKKYICHEEWPSNTQNYYYTLALLTLQFIVPLIVLIFTYTRIACAVWGKRPPGEAENSRDQRMARSKRKMIKMMVMVVIVFTMCWLPFNVLVILLNDDAFKIWEPLPYFWFAFHWLAMSHSCYNPIIYCYMNARFRGGFLQIIYRVPGLRRCCCLRRYLQNRGERNYDATGEMTFKFNAGNGGGLLRKPKIRIRHGRHIPLAASKHINHIHKHPEKTPNEFYANESIFMCGGHSVAVVPAP
ncbi:RYamide receptor isoform X1 [Bactrocera dorsalis]|uniref:RYamide receptor isoform X1 n=1 Tax=Bactrocera dorsalis TaxID=27457 RepID=A0ABM3J596_BACDO|nr:RYamide receptor isoform X1 [Bactrocera dorsalis]XP_049304379.1 RYamide receptor isoform X1 [Bactrocera dorsalis]XP_049304380.1 RYamide receptor isoform X1 [Bactrocera dorsalis]XP_049304381.1 RYamide receptor isoform X1 [Bactrocera dorsalis]XP_049304382.1 RYamide receptor isoform X1 [Bactrocera dorsalis]